MALHDVDEDGDIDIITQYFEQRWFGWRIHRYNRFRTEHVINDTTGRGFDVVVTDMNNDGYEDIVYVITIISCQRCPMNRQCVYTGLRSHRLKHLMA